jgi:hypothetical protein
MSAIFPWATLYNANKAKAVPLHATKALGGEEVYLLLKSTSALDGGEWSASRPGRTLAPGKGPSVPIVQEAGWAPETFWTQSLEEKYFRLCRGSNLDGPVVQPVARHYTDWTIRLTYNANIIKIYHLWCWNLISLMVKISFPSITL